MSSTAPDPAGAPPPLTAEQADATIRSRPYIVLLVLVADRRRGRLAGRVVLPRARPPDPAGGVHPPAARSRLRGGAPKWWPLIVLPIAGVLVARWRSRGCPAAAATSPPRGLATGGSRRRRELPGRHAGRDRDDRPGARARPRGAADRARRRDSAVLSIRLVRRGRRGPGARRSSAAAGTFAALSFIFASPLIAAVILIEATGIGGPRLPLILLPGLLAAGIGSLVSIGMGSFTGLSSSAYALGALPLPTFGPPHIGNFGWTIALAIAVAAGERGHHARRAEDVPDRRPAPLLVLPIVGLVIGGLATLVLADRPATRSNDVLFSGQDRLPGLVTRAGDLLGRGAGAADRLQGHRLLALAGQLPRRPDVPGDVPRRRRRDHVLAAARHADRCRGRVGMAAGLPPCCACP